LFVGMQAAFDSGIIDGGSVHYSRI